nr:hypothetical protein [Nocardioides panzhihuensis]
MFAVPTAALTMQTSLGLVPTGDGAVCYRAAAGAGFAGTQDDVVELLGASEAAPKVSTSVDEFGFTWLSVDHEPLDPANPDITGLVTDLHAVNTTLEMNGFGPGLLCSLIGFEGADGRSVGLIYLYKQGTFYPFVPTGPQQRDNLLEINVRTAIEGDLPVEKDLSRWLAVWGAPGL